MRQIIFFITMVLLSFFSLELNAQCGTNGTESAITIIPTTSNQNTSATQGVGSGSRRIYSGFTPGNSYTFSLDNGPGNLSCRQGIFLNSSNAQIGSWFDISSSTTQVSPANTSKFYITTSRSSNWNTTSATLTYRANTTVTTPVNITGTETDENCPGDNDGAISSINITNALTDVQYIKLTQRRTSNNYINLAELRAYGIFGAGNVALGTTVTSNVGAYSGWGYDGLTDGNTGSAGADQAHTGSAAFGNYVQVDLGSGQELDYIEIVNRNGCCYDRASNLLLELFNSSGKLVYSNGISLPNSSLGTYTQNVLDVSWSDAATTLNRTGLSSGTYTLNYSDVAGNSGSNVFDIDSKTESGDPTSANSDNSFVCAGSPVSLSVTGGSLGTSATWEWYSDASLTTSVGNGNPLVINPLVSETYYVRAEGDCNNTAVFNTGEVLVNGTSATSGTETLPSSTATSSCMINDNNWHHFYDSNGDLLAAINSNNQDLGNVTVTIEVGNDGPYGTGLAPGICGSSAASPGEYALARNWDITVGTQPTTPVDVKFYYNSSELTDLSNTIAALTNSADYISCWGNVTTESDLMMTVSHTSGSTQLFPTLVPTAGPGTGLREVAFSLTEFSSGILHSNGGLNSGNPLPVELLTFKARPMENEYIQISWTTATEINNEGFELLRSIDGTSFEKIAWIEGSGNSKENQTYSFDDYTASKGTYYYKLRQIDFDGAIEEFNVISATITPKYEVTDIVVRPIPTSNSITLDFLTNNYSNTLISVYNYSGQKVMELNKDLYKGSNSLTLDEVDELSSGIYYINLTVNDKVFTKKFVVSK